MSFTSTRNAALALALAGATLACTGPAAFAAATITNGEFESGSIGDTAITGWNVVNERIDLGVDEIAGCLTVDDSNYSDLFTDDYATAPEMVDRNDSYVSDVDLIDATYGTEISDATLLSAPFTSTGQVVRLSSNMHSPSSGYVVHGPAIYSDTFNANTIDDLSFRWAATGEEDDYHVFGYLLNADTCVQTEVLDGSGSVSNWADISVPIPENGTYRFVFVAGTYDLTWGGAAGAVLLLDDIVLTVNEERAAESNAHKKGKLAATGFDSVSTGLVGLSLAILGAGVALLRRVTRSRRS